MSGDVKPGLVSVVVASYNHAKYLQQRMDSLISQTYQNIEILVIDDCSPDNSVEILRQYESNPKVRLIVREKNGGWVTVSNQGVELSSGEFVIFANCDDACDPRMIERLVESINRNATVGIAFCRSVMIDESNRVLGDDYAIREKSFRERCSVDTLLSGSEVSRYLLHSCVIPNLSAALIRRECFERVGYLSSDYKVCCDWDLFFRIAACFDFAYVAAPLNHFRQHKKTIRSITKDRVVFDEYFRLLLGQIRLLDLTFFERMKYRTHVMYLWSVHLVAPSTNGISNLTYHLSRICHLDCPALIFFVPGFLLRVGEVIKKILNRTFVVAFYKITGSTK